MVDSGMSLPGGLGRPLRHGDRYVQRRCYLRHPQPERGSLRSLLRHCQSQGSVEPFEPLCTSHSAPISGFSSADMSRSSDLLESFVEDPPSALVVVGEGEACCAVRRS